MPGAAKLIYWDACCFLNYIDGADLQTLDALLESSGRGEIQIATSVLSMTEVAFAASEKKNASLDKATEDKINALWEDTSVVQLVEFFPLIAGRARALIRESLAKKWRLTPPDANSSCLSGNHRGRRVPHIRRGAASLWILPWLFGDQAVLATTEAAVVRSIRVRQAPYLTDRPRRAQCRSSRG